MGTTKQILPAVAAVIFNDNGEVLLQKRKDVNKWCIISGHVEFGETIEAAILREIEEETNTSKYHSPHRCVFFAGFADLSLQ
jgi:8-oxo-dGTP pyrophosphatase MutT (NUDIX family)